MALCALLVLVVAGCSSAGEADEPATDSPGGSDIGPGAEPETAPEAEQDDPVESAALTADDIVAAIEPDGFACEEKDPVLKGREQVIQCKGDDYVIITATRLTSSDLLPGQLTRAKEALCESGTVDALRVATSDVWVVVPGGDRDKDIAAFEAATGKLGLEPTEDPC